MRTAFRLPSTFLLVASTVVPSLAATDLYVSPSGDNANEGTETKPFATLERARDEIRALRMSQGNEHSVESNEIHHVCQIADDAGAITLAHDPTFRGNQIVRNDIHDIGGFGHKDIVVELLITDREMPGISGLALLHSVKNQQPFLTHFLIDLSKSTSDLT